MIKKLGLHFNFKKKAYEIFYSISCYDELLFCTEGTNISGTGV